MDAIVHLTSHRFTPRAHPAIWRQVLGLAAHGRQVVLEAGDAAYVPGGRRPEDERALARAGVRVHRVERPGLRREEYAARLAAGLARAGGRPRAVVAHLGNNGWRALALARALDAPIFTLFHGSDARALLDPRWRPRFERLARTPGARFGGVSRNVVEALAAWGLPPERIHLQHLGVDVARLPAAPPAPRGDGLRILVVGRFVSFKDHATAVEAFARHRARHPASTLALYGDGPLRPAIEARVRALGIGAAVRFGGAVPFDELRAAHAGADVAMLTSRRDAEGAEEGLPNAVLEAMAQGLPVVATRHAGIPEAVVDGETGWLVPEGDAAATAERLDRIAAAPEHAARMGRAGRARVEAAFDARRQAERLGALLAAMRRDFDAIPRATRAAAWRRATAGLVAPLARFGRRRRALLAGRRAWVRLVGPVAPRPAGRGPVPPRGLGDRPVDEPG